MKLQLVGLNHRGSDLAVREQVAFQGRQVEDALLHLRDRFPGSEAVVLSTCNRVEVYTASEREELAPSHQQIIDFLAEFHGIESRDVLDGLMHQSGEEAVRHLFQVTASLDSMVVGEAQILSQVKEAYERAIRAGNAGPMMHAVFQAGLRVARRVASETTINQRRTSVPSVAVRDFARRIFERFDDKQILLIGAGEMAEETLRYLRDEGARRFTIINRRAEKATAMARQYGGVAAPWESLTAELIQADLVVSTTSSDEPIMDGARFRPIDTARYQRPLAILDLAVPRDFAADVGDALGVYLYSIDDLAEVCEKNRQAREKEWPAAERIVEEETTRFMSDWYYRVTGPTIKQLKDNFAELKEEELQRLFNKLPELDEKSRGEVVRSFDRLMNKMLYPPLAS
ncbi:MAG: glutamyl-tRNA reductase, partial [Planctomycetota bacterium]